jgi:hypothetical protein
MTHDEDGAGRYVLHAIRSLPVPAPPADFARQMEILVQDLPEDAATEQWLLRIAAGAGLAFGVATVAPWLAASMTSLAVTLGPVPWRLLTVLAAGLTAFAVVDRFVLRHSLDTLK